MAMQRYGESSITLGQTHLDSGDFIPPRVKVVQQMSGEAADKKAAPGDFFNTLTGTNYGSKLLFIPIQTFKQRILLVRQDRRKDIEATLGSELSEGDGLKCRSFDMLTGIGEPGIACAECPLSQWGEANTPPHCTETYNVAALTADEGELIILGFQKSSAKVGKRLFSMLRMATRAKPWASVYEAATRQEKGPKGPFFVPDVVKTSEQTPDELMRFAQEWAVELGGVTIDVTPPDAVEEDAADAKF